MSADFAFKIVVLGNPAVGKTSLIVRFIKNKFTEDYKTTLGVDFLTKQLELYGKAKIRLMLWDMGGQDKWLSRRAKFMRGADGAIIVYSNTDLESYLQLDKWIDEVYQYANGDVPICIVRNKSDLPPIRENLFPQKILERLSTKLIETSAKTGENVEEMFSYISSAVVKQKAKQLKSKV
ncbi:MAG: GTP-binding protein [Candidatus Lokiarchaeota archaeon]|nr:GTP-binding protein [Candidatus Lokiarchaeota archaeon]